MKYVGNNNKLYGVLFKVSRIKPKSNGETVLNFGSKNTTNYQDNIDGIKLSDLRLYDFLTNKIL